MEKENVSCGSIVHLRICGGFKKLRTPLLMYHLATIRLAYVWFCNRTAKGTSNVVKPLYLEGAEKLPFFLK